MIKPTKQEMYSKFGKVKRKMFSGRLFDLEGWYPSKSEGLKAAKFFRSMAFPYHVRLQSYKGWYLLWRRMPTK
jgi:hypothetical protein